MDAVTTIPAGRIAEIQKDAKAAVSAEARLRRAYVTVFKSLYQFGQDFGEAPVKVELASKGITVRSDAQHPHWVGVCKLAFGADEGYAQQVNKYSNVLAYAEATTVKLEEIDGWLGDKTLTSKIQAARLYFGKTESGGGQSKTQKLLTQEIEKIEEAWEPLLSEIDGMPSSVRLDEIKAAGIKIEPGRVEILAEMDAEGNLVPIGIIQAKDEKLYDLIKPRAVRRASSALHTLDHVTDLYAFADVIPMGTKKPRSLIVKCTDEAWMMYTVNPTMLASAIAVARFNEPHLQLPVGTWDFTVDDQKALSVLLSNFKSMKWDIRKNKGGDCEIEIKDGANKTVAQRQAEINDARKKAWQNKKDKGEKVSTSALEFTWPGSVSKQTLTLEDATTKKVAHINKGVVFGEDDHGVAEQVALRMSHALRERIRTTWANDLKAKLSSKPQVRIRFGIDGMSFFGLKATERLARIDYEVGAPKGFERFYDTDGRLLVSTFDAMDAAIGEADCTLAFSKTILRLRAEADGAEYTIYLPELGAQNSFKTTEIGSGPVV